MTLNTNEIVYTADLMNISPANDAQIYGLSGDWIISGLQLTSITSTSAVLTAGKAIIQGRLFELKANTTYTLTAGKVQYLGLGIDLSQSNSDNGDGTITNNQFTVGSSDTVYGDTLQGDIQSFVGLYSVDGNGGYTQRVFNYYRKHVGIADYGYGYFQDYANDQVPTAIRDGRTVHIYGAVRNKYATNPDTKNVFRVLPIDMRPAMQVNIVAQGSQNGIFMLQIDTNGEISVSRGRMGGNSYTFPVGSWFNLACSFNIEY